MPKIPQAVYQYLQRHSEATGKEVADELHIPTRTARRYKQWFRENRVEAVYEQEVISLSQDVEEEFDVDEFFEWADQQEERLNQRDPVLTTDEYDFKTDQPVAVLFASCAHLGGRYTNYKKFRDIFNQVLQIPRLYYADLGDFSEGFFQSFKDVKSVNDQLLNSDQQLDIVKAVLGKLRDHNKLLFGVAGQHGSWWQSSRYGKDPVKQIYRELKRPYFDGRGYVKFKIGNQDYNIAFAHKFKGSSEWNPSHPQVKALRFNYPNASVVVMGDRHFPSIQQFATYMNEYEMGNRPSPMVTLLQAGTAKEGPDPYTIRNFDRGYLGWPILVFRPNEHRIEWTWHLDTVEALLDA